MDRYNAVIEYSPSNKSDEQAMLEVEQSAFSKAIPHLRGKKFKSLRVETSHQREIDYADLSTARCIVYLEEA